MFASDKSRSLGLAPQASTDVVNYEVYTEDDGSNPKHLERLCTQCLASAQAQVSGHIWQRDGFNLQPSTSRQPPWRAAKQKASSADERAIEEPLDCLWGQTGYGDNVEDEWLVTWLLLELTSRFKGLSARAWDGDGEFLLIEAAYALPKWLKPEQAPERVWLRGGEVHLIPPPSPQHPGLPAAPTTRQALKILRAQKVDTRAPDAMQAAVLSRLQGYPDSIAKGIHRARVLIPKSVAALLQRDPQLVAPAVEKFHYRDLDDLRAARRMDHFPLKDMVSTVVRFSRCLYAQLATQQYEAPRGVLMPLPSEHTFSAASLGVKLTAGFEMLLAASPEAGSAASGSQEGTAAAPSAGQSASASLHSTEGQGSQAGVASDREGKSGSGTSVADLSSNPAWQRYLQGLEEKGYFVGELPSSKRHRELTAAAAQRFRETPAYQEMSQQAASSPAGRIAALLREPLSLDEAKVEEEDSDSWLAEGAAELDAQLEQRRRELSEEAAGHTNVHGGGELTHTSERLEAFFSGKGGLEGAEIPADMDGKVDFDDQQFWREMKQVLGIPGGIRDDDSDEGSSFYSDNEMSDDENPISRGGAPSPPASHTVQQQSSPAAISQLPAAHITALPPTGLQCDSTAYKAGKVPKAPGASQKGPEAHTNDDREQQWEAATATDSDDEAEFDASYSQVLEEQLRGDRISHLSAAERQPGTSPTAGKTPSGPGPSGGSAPNNQLGEDGDSLAPVDIDMNLVENLLASYTAQQGMPGPAGNLAGLLGLQLPGGRQGGKDAYGDFLASLE